MKSIKLILGTFFFGMIILQGCEMGKYDDGPLFSFYPDKNRITKEWKLSKFSVNGDDSTANFKCNSCPFFLKFDKSNLLLANYMINGQLQVVSNGSWNFEGNGKQVNLLTSDMVVAGPIMNNGIWDVTRSTKKQLWISHLKNGKLYEIQLN